MYRAGDTYLRLGEKDKLQRDLLLHRQMEASGFPVARVIGEGGYKNLFYFVEESLGEKHFGELFAEDCVVSGKISDEHFASFLEITERYGLAQLKTAVPDKRTAEFASGIHLDDLCGELPDDADAIREHFSGVIARTVELPFVVAHGDFNPSNLYPAGVIDLEDSFYAPAGYDLVTNIVHIDNFPDSPEYEFFRKYQFTDKQKQAYYDVVDNLYGSQGLPKISSYKEDFEFCRAVWAAVHMHAWPKVQRFRYDRLRQKFLNVTL